MIVGGRFPLLVILVFGLGTRAWDIPSMDELGAIPGVDATDVRSVVRFVFEMEGRAC